jgi:hypothetical protein
MEVSEQDHVDNTGDKLVLIDAGCGVSQGGSRRPSLIGRQVVHWP